MTARSRCARAWSQVRMAVVSTPCSINSLRRLIAGFGWAHHTYKAHRSLHARAVSMQVTPYDGAGRLHAACGNHCSECKPARDVTSAISFSPACHPLSICEIVEDGQATTSNIAQSLDIGLSASSGSCRRSASQHDMSNAPSPAHLSL
jgi:bacterioferritin-associated ferredoxin